MNDQDSTKFDLEALKEERRKREELEKAFADLRKSDPMKEDVL